MNSSSMLIVEVQNLRVHFYQKGSAGIQVIKVVDGIDLSLYRGRTLCLVGGSGSGKSAVCRAIAGARRGGEVVSGRLRLDMGGGLPAVMDLDGEDNTYSSFLIIAKENGPSLAALRILGKQMIQAVRCGRSISMEAVSRRVVIQRALDRKPSVLIIDDLAAVLKDLDQDEVLDRISESQQETGTAVLCATRDLDLAARLADDVAVMHQGRVVEAANTHTIFTEPKHPYTQVLLAGAAESSSFRKACPSPGCLYRACCPQAETVCEQFDPRMVTVGERHDVRCFACESMPVEPAAREEQRTSAFDMWQIECFLMRY